MTASAFPHQRIRESEDRSWTLQLLHEVVESDNATDLDEIVSTLQILDDFRVLVPLTFLMENRSAEQHLRATASEILYGCTTSETPAQRRQWWSSGDDILMRHAVRMAAHTEADLIEQIAGNPDHPFYIDAINTLAVRFEEPRFQLLKVEALSHPDADVRAVAANVIFWDQPLAAEQGLLRVAQEDDHSAAKEALDALAYYHSQSVLIGLFAMSTSAPVARRQLCETALAEVREAFLDQLLRLEDKNSEAASIFRIWLKPVWDILGIDGNQAVAQTNDQIGWQPQPSSNDEVISLAVTVDDIIARFDDADGKWADIYNHIHLVDWISFSPDEKERLVHYFSNHLDWAVRDASCSILGMLGASDVLLKFLDDPVFAVRKGATYYIREVPRSNQIATRLWEMLQENQIQGTQASEALESYVVHAQEANLDDRLLQLAGSDTRESVRTKAIAALCERCARDQIRSLVPILSTKPLVTWSAHDALLQACAQLNIAVPSIEKLSAIDDIYLQASLADLLANTARENSAQAAPNI